MFIYRKILRHERGLKFRDGAFVGVVPPGRGLEFDPLKRLRIDIVSTRPVWLSHKELDLIAKSGQMGEELRLFDLKDYERALVWIDGRFTSILGPGVHAYWASAAEVKAEIYDVRQGRFEHADLQRILKSGGSSGWLDSLTVEAGRAGLVFIDGRHAMTFGPGVYAFWKGGATKIELSAADLREQAVELAGQEIMTADRVTLRLNATLAYKVVDPVKAVAEVADARQAIYREAQLALRAIVGSMELDALLAGKDAVAARLVESLRPRALALGLEVLDLGVRDVILPGEMKELLNKVTEAKKAAEAAVITRREETATTRSQANTAKIYEGNPTLMRLRELETLEKVAAKANFTVMLGEGSLADRVVKMV